MPRTEKDHQLEFKDLSFY